MGSSRKSEWITVSCETDREKDAIRSWFCGLADELIGPTRASILVRIADDRTMKLRALFIKDGKVREMSRTFGKTFRISMGPEKPTEWHTT